MTPNAPTAQRRCPNCSKEHNNTGNHYCEDCSRFFSKIGGYPVMPAPPVPPGVDDPVVYALKYIRTQFHEAIKPEDTCGATHRLWCLDQIEKAIAHIAKQPTADAGAASEGAAVDVSLRCILIAQSRDRYREALRFIRDHIGMHGGFSQCLAKLEEVGFSHDAAQRPTHTPKAEQTATEPVVVTVSPGDKPMSAETANAIGQMVKAVVKTEPVGAEALRKLLCSTHDVILWMLQEWMKYKLDPREPLDRVDKILNELSAIKAGSMAPSGSAHCESCLGSGLIISGFGQDPCLCCEGTGKAAQPAPVRAEASKWCASCDTGAECGYAGKCLHPKPAPGTKEYDEETELLQEARDAMRNTPFIEMKQPAASAPAQAAKHAIGFLLSDEECPEEYARKQAARSAEPDAKRDTGDEESALAAYADKAGYPIMTDTWKAAWHASAQATRRRCKEAVEALFAQPGSSMHDPMSLWQIEGFFRDHDEHDTASAIKQLAALLQSEFAENSK